MTPLPTLPILWEKDRCPIPSLDGGETLPSAALDAFRACLDAHGAILLRGYGVASTAEMARAVAALGGQPMPYVEGNSPRTKLDAGGVYTSTEHPAEAFISMHNELSYSASWPNRLYFCCVTPAQTGGHTLLASSGAILDGLDAPVREAFEAKGVLYIRNLHGGGACSSGRRGRTPSRPRTARRSKAIARASRSTSSGATRMRCGCSHGVPPARCIRPPAGACGSTRRTSSIHRPTAPTCMKRWSTCSATIPSRSRSMPASAMAVRSARTRSRTSAALRSGIRCASIGSAAIAS